MLVISKTIIDNLVTKVTAIYYKNGYYISKEVKKAD